MPPNRAPNRHPGCLAAMAPLLLLAGCPEGSRSPQPRYSVPEVGIELPQLSGWVPDDGHRLVDRDQGGIALRLVRKGSVAGSPRIDVVLEPKRPRPSKLETFVNQNLREMAALESSGKIRIVDVSRHPVQIGPRRAFRVRHEYTMGTGTAQVAITQTSLFLILDERGIAISAAGRTELYHPLADSIEQMLSGVSVAGEAPQSPSQPVRADRPNPAEPEAPAPTVQPVDLGKIGGN